MVNDEKFNLEVKDDGDFKITGVNSRDGSLIVVSNLDEVNKLINNLKDRGDYYEEEVQDYHVLLRKIESLIDKKVMLTINVDSRVHNTSANNDSDYIKGFYNGKLTGLLEIQTELEELL
ncbi:MAG: hypothetical protein IJH63_10450 [Methanobrevibacter sp.]|nr:hypothetical protein [Methanosphaera sp.]MBR0371120.1 hypothetical protein [Methanobrevibacter sp.]